MKEKENENVVSETITLYVIRDDILDVFVHCVFLDEKIFTYYFIDLVNSPESKYFNTPHTYSLYKLCDLNTKSGELININKEYLHNLSEFVDDELRQRIIDLRTLNFVPSGFEKLPDDVREELIHEKKQILEHLLQKGVEKNDKTKILQ